MIGRDTNAMRAISRSRRLRGTEASHQKHFMRCNEKSSADFRTEQEHESELGLGVSMKELS